MIDLLTEDIGTGDYYYVPVEGTYTVTYSGTFDGATVSLQVQAEDAADNLEAITVPESSKTEAYIGRVYLDPTLPVRAVVTSPGVSTSISVVLT